MNISAARNFRNACINIVGRTRIMRCLNFACRAVGVWPCDLHYFRVGVNKHESFEISGEAYLLQHLAKKLPENTTIVEVGANIGEYTEELIKRFPKATIHAIEPSASAFETLNRKVSKAAHVYNLALGEEKGTATLYSYPDLPDSTHASMHSRVLTELHGAEAVVGQTVEVVTLDEFCERQNITHIDFLKIDVEGHEMSVLKGATRMLSDKNIDAIQFEFNSMNIVSRVFLRDFYDVLTDFEIYRLDTSRLIPLFEYIPQNEIFAFQNFFAVRRPKAENGA